MRRVAHLLILSFLLALNSAPAQGTERAKTIRTSYFFSTAEVSPWTVPSTEPFSIYIIQPGVEVELLSFERSGNDFLQVRLRDGSIGYMSVLSFTDVSLPIDNYRNHLKTVSGKEIPDGNYSVIPSGQFNYKTIQGSYPFPSRWRAVPDKLVLKNKAGRTYDISRVEQYEERYEDTYRYWTYSPVSRLYRFGDFQSVLDKLPDSYFEESFQLWFNPEKRSLDAFAGCSKSYMESILGAPYAYVGPDLSEFPGMTYALYSTLLWKAEGKHWDKGIVVFYDEHLAVTHVSLRPFNWEFGAHHAYSAPLYVPFRPLARTDRSVISAIEGTPARYIQAGSGAEPGVERVTKPGLPDRFRIGVMCFYERSLGLRNPFAIAGIMLLVLILSSLLCWVWIRYIFNYGSNKWAVARCYLLPLPLLLFSLVYIWRYPFLFFLLVGSLFLITEFIPYWILGETIKYNRCPHCHQYVHPERMYSREGDFIGDDYRETGEGIHLSTVTGDAGYICKQYKYASTMSVRQEMVYGVKCPLCGHEWEQDRSEPRPSCRGPIIIVERGHYYEYKTKTTVITKRLVTKSGRELDRKEEEQTSTTSTRHEIDMKTVDIDRFKPYFDLYTHGDKQALDRYYERYWDTTTRDAILLSRGKK